MLGYCTVRDVRLALAPSTMWTEAAARETAVSLPNEQIVDAINEAEGIVKQHTSTRYTIPIIDATEPDTSTPPVDVAISVAPDPIRGITRSIAAYLATLTYRRNKDLGADDPIRLRFNLAMTTLVDIRAGVADLPDDFPSTSTGDSGGAVFNLYEGTMFGMEDVGLIQTGPYRSPAQYLVPYETWRI